MSLERQKNTCSRLAKYYISMTSESDPSAADEGLSDVQESSFDSSAFLKTLTHKPGVYRMLDAGKNILYIGKAKDLHKRVSSYFRKSGLLPKTSVLMGQVCDIEITVTHTESEALILESNLIKKYRPRYNVLLRDDKSYPYIYLSADQDFPRLSFHRGARRVRGRYFGPYPSSGAVRDSLSLLQKLFPVRQCDDSFFRNRSRPCLQYQIKRCTAPCVDLISKEAYQQDVKNAVLFLEGKSTEVINGLVDRMEKASELQEYELAAKVRDQISSLQKVQERQYVSGERGDLDVIACAVKGGMACVQVFFIRNGRNLGNKCYFPKIPRVQQGDNKTAPEEVISSFIPQYYLDEKAEKPIPEQILTSHLVSESALLEQALSGFKGNEAEVSKRGSRHKVRIRSGVRGERARWVKMATANADHALAAELASKAGIQKRLEALQEALDLDQIPGRLECFDISHTMGEATVASCVVFDTEGPRKSDYRRFNIEGIEPGDDYAAMHQALMRRYTKVKRVRVSCRIYC